MAMQLGLITDMWHSIEDNPPEIGVPVLITNGEVTVVASRSDFPSGKLWWRNEGFSGYDWEWAWQIERGPDPTHWMKLPELPSKRGSHGREI
jgi:hypothetical protein